MTAETFTDRTRAPLLSLAFIGGIAYCVLTFISFTFYPEPFSPFDDYLSVLGNSTLNPNGAVFYNLAVIQAGLLLPLFYAGLYKAFGEQGRSKLLTLAVLVGVFNSLSVTMSGVFSENVYELHYMWSLLIFITWIPVLFLTNIALLKQGGYIAWVCIYGLILGIIDTFFVLYALLIGTDTGSLSEWVTIFSFIGWTMLLAISALKRKN